MSMSGPERADARASLARWEDDGRHSYDWVADYAAKALDALDAAEALLRECLSMVTYDDRDEAIEAKIKAFLDGKP